MIFLFNNYWFHMNFFRVHLFEAGGKRSALNVLYICALYIYNMYVALQISRISY